MLDAKDYKQYETHRKHTFSTPKYLLRHWTHYERNISKLCEAERANAKRLYDALGHLTEEERLFLARKYRAELEKDRGYTQRHRLDKDLAEEHGMEQADYAELRQGIELKFLHYLKRIDEVLGRWR